MEKHKTNYKDFLELCLQGVKEAMGEGYLVQMNTVLKNNSIVMDGIVILKDGVKITPNIYLQSFYEQYEEGVEIDVLIDEILNVYCDKMTEKEEMKLDFTYEALKDLIVFRVVNYEKNEELLRNSPHLRILDLAITFHCLVQEKEETIGTIRITNQHIAMWGISLEQVAALARRNTPKLLPPSLRRMEDVLGELIEGEDLKMNDGEDPAFGETGILDGSDLYILSNNKGINGAACIFYDGVIRDFARVLKCDFYILPSSIHEVILLPFHDLLEQVQLEEMVVQINREQVPYEEILSDHVYYYSLSENQIKCLS